MDQKQRLDYLVEKFKEDSGEYRNLKVSDNDVEKRRILRSLMNIRMPRHMDEEILKVQDEFLKEDAREKRNRDPGSDPDGKRGVPQYCAFCGKNLYLAGRYHQTSGGSYRQCSQLPDAGLFCTLPQMY